MTSFAQSIGPTPSAALVREIHRRSGLSQARLARRAGLPRSVVNVYLKGRREPGVDALARLAAAAGLELDLRSRRPAVDPESADAMLTQVLELAESLPYRPRGELGYPSLRKRLSGKADAQ